eukprot:3992070-Amphidinium_carterae.3
MGTVERYHQTIFAQLRTAQLQCCKDYNISHITQPKNQLTQFTTKPHATSQYSTYFYATQTARHSTSDPQEKLAETLHTQPILQFGDKIYMDNLMAENMKLYQCNSQRKYKTIWIGRDTTIGQPITPTRSTVRQRIHAQDSGTTAERKHVQENKQQNNPGTRNEKKLTTETMSLQEWYNDDNIDYHRVQAQELKDLIQEEHNSLQKTQVLKRMN